MKAMLLAAGRGERMRPITDSLPKPLLQVGDRALIAWHLAALARAGIREVVINASWHGQQLRETGGGILRAVPLLGPGPFLVINGDVWTDVDFGRLGLASGAHAHLVLVANPPHHPHGDFGLEGDLVVERDGGERLTYSGIGVYRPEFFDGCTAERFPLLPVLKRAIAARLVRGELHRGEWCDVGTPDRLARLRARVAALQ